MYHPKLSIRGMDEAFLDITEYCQKHAMSPEDVVQEMRAKITEATGLTA
jgi:DNA polymerase kappa